MSGKRIPYPDPHAKPDLYYDTEMAEVERYFIEYVDFDLMYKDLFNAGRKFELIKLTLELQELIPEAERLSPIMWDKAFKVQKNAIINRFRTYMQDKFFRDLPIHSERKLGMCWIRIDELNIQAEALSLYNLLIKSGKYRIDSRSYVQQCSSLSEMDFLLYTLGLALHSSSAVPDRNTIYSIVWHIGVRRGNTSDLCAGLNIIRRNHGSSTDFLIAEGKDFIGLSS